MTLTYKSLLVNGAEGWHDGSGTITYSFLGKVMPSYYSEVDTDNDGKADAWDVKPPGEGPQLIKMATDTDPAQDFSMTADERATTVLAINAWNEVANIHMVPGTIVAGGTVTGAPITGNGSFGTATGTPIERSDDGSQSIDISAVFEDGLNFFGTKLDNPSVFVNTNGSISLNEAISTFTPKSIVESTVPMIAPFWGDVDGRPAGPVLYNVDTVADVVTFTWQDVGYYDNHDDKTNAFQLQLFDRGGGDFDIVFRYSDINWTTGDSSSGSGGTGGEVAHAGFSAGNGADYFELPQSGDSDGMLGLEQTVGNTGVPGLWVFEVRDGTAVGDITFGSSEFKDKNFGFSNFPDKSVLGKTPSQAGDIWIDTSNSRQLESPSLGQTSWQTYLHEIGHALGLHHPNEDPYNKDGEFENSNRYTVMSYEPDPNQEDVPEDDRVWPLTPMIFDIQAIQKLYGANTATRNGNTSYFGAGAGGAESAYQYAQDGMTVQGYDGNFRTVYLTIWDGGGTDLIDGSSLTTKLTINLEPGTLSSIGGKANIGLAAAVTVGGSIVNYIENASGGSKDDKIDGNGAANSLLGNGGSDQIRGLLGNDNLVGGLGRDNIDGGVGNDTIYGDGRKPADGGAKDNDKLFGGDGKDTMLGNDGDDVVSGDDGDDVLDGGAGNDQLLGGTGDDKIGGGDGSDELDGGAGKDLVIGGKGADRFITKMFSNSKEVDTFMDFKHSDKDKILISADDTLALYQDNVPKKHDHEYLLYLENSGKLFIVNSPDADHDKELLAIFDNRTELVRGDFIFA